MKVRLTPYDSRNKVFVTIKILSPRGYSEFWNAAIQYCDREKDEFRLSIDRGQMFFFGTREVFWVYPLRDVFRMIDTPRYLYFIWRRKHRVHVPPVWFRWSYFVLLLKMPIFRTLFRLSILKNAFGQSQGWLFIRATIDAKSCINFDYSE